MALIIVPVSTVDSRYVQTTSLDGTDYNLEFKWNDREQKWYLDISSTEGTKLAVGIKLVSDWPLLKLQTSEALPQGELYAIDSTGQGEDPGLRDLGDRVTLFYMEESSFE